MKWIVRSESLSMTRVAKDAVIVDEGPPHLFDTEEEVTKLLNFFLSCFGDIFFGGKWQVLAIN